MPAPNNMDDLKPVAGDNSITNTTRINEVDDYIRGTQSIIRKGTESANINLTGTSITLNQSNQTYTLTGTGTLNTITGLWTNGTATIFVTGLITLQSGDTVSTTTTARLQAGDSFTVTKQANGVFTVIGFTRSKGSTVTGCTVTGGVLNLNGTMSGVVTVGGTGNVTSITGGVAGQLYTLVFDYDLVLQGINFPRGETSVTLLKMDTAIIECSLAGGYWLKSYSKPYYQHTANVSGGAFQGGFNEYYSNTNGYDPSIGITLGAGKWLVCISIVATNSGGNQDVSSTLVQWEDVNQSSNDIYSSTFHVRAQGTVKTSTSHSAYINNTSGGDKYYRIRLKGSQGNANRFIAIGLPSEANSLFATFIGA